MLAWLSNSLATELLGTAAHADTARDVWLDLEERFTQGIDARMYELRSAIASLRQDKSTVLAYYGRLKILWVNCSLLMKFPYALVGNAPMACPRRWRRSARRKWCLIS